MKAEIITIGDEILIGQIVDTNSAWIARRLNDAGFTATRKLTVGDQAGEIETAVSNAMRANDAVIVTGGLGPTRDDITKTTLARMWNCGMVRDEDTFRRNEQTLAARGIAYNELNQAQALVPEAATVLPNLNGTAPGMWLERDGAVVVSLPGVPFEMERLMQDEVLPRLSARFSTLAVVHRTAVTYGIAESLLAERIAAWEDALPGYLHLAYLPSTTQMKLRLSAYDVDYAEASREIDRRFAELERIIPEHFVGYGEISVAEAAAALLRTQGRTLAVAESCTGGALSAQFTALAGASDYFLGGVVSYSNSVKSGVLGVPEETIAAHGAVSSETACLMAEGVRRLCGADYALATTGIAGPGGGSDDKPVGTVWIALASAEGTEAHRYVFGRLRRQNIERAATTAVDMLRRKLRGA